MKKFKMLPAIMMLVLCVATLAIGVFALAPTQNAFTGSITINAVNPNIIITAYKLEIGVETQFFGPQSARKGLTIPLGDQMTMNAEDLNDEDELDSLDIKFIIKIENPSTENKLGAYFSSVSMEQQLGDGDDEKIICTRPLKTEKGTEGLAQATMTGYRQISKAVGSGSDVVNGIVKMELTF